MSADGKTRSVLSRKLELGREQAGGNPKSILRALRRGLVQAARESLNLSMCIIGARQARRQLEELRDALEDGWLYLLFAAHDGRRAAACVDPGCVAAIIQQQTTGQVSGGEIVRRRYTETDAAMVAPLIELTLARAEGLVETAEDRRCLSAFGYLSRADDLQGLQLALEQEVYRVCELTVEIAGGQRQGGITVVVPEPATLADHDAEAAASPGWRLEQVSGVMRADLTAVIGQMQLPLSELASLNVGNLLPLTGTRLDRTCLLTIERRKVAIGRLGQCGGMKAVRINENPSGPGSSTVQEASFRAYEVGAPDKREKAVLTNPSNAARKDMSSTVAPSHTAGELAADDESALQRLTPEQAIAEISELAGLADLEN
ncbi:flagellar motor switch protein FliM [Ruegeria sediminis]|uniref:Flagellar motor switch protein FliM n=1 Tax=Ruegeria sediminis TaxID=2583820 RepID=A0ABY2X3U2_9RHOB|nr:FliM/FliN family flagellar motor C-terminal domain-containing protein [Ruegeria sediminis]TMV09704.1 flagellar motor switch protein FliM [Ruegeria sediminis]